MQFCENAIYAHAKGSCYVCLQPHLVVDTEVQIEGEGSLVICRGCIRDLANTAGYTVDERADYEAKIAELKDQVFEAEKISQEAEVILAQLEKTAKEAIARRMARIRAAKESPKAEVGA